MFLACSKRLHEIKTIGAQARPSLKNYSRQTLRHMMSVSSCCTIVFYALGASTKGEVMILSTTLVMLGMFRYYAFMMQGENDSPTDVLLQDKQMYLIVSLWLFVCAVGLIYGK